MRGKKGLESEIIVVFIILIIGFLVVLYVYWQFHSTGTIDKEVCHQSVVTRDALKLGALEAGTNLVKLKCKTEKICFLMPGEDEDACEGMISKKDSPINFVKLSGEKSEAEKEIKDVLANSMYDCNWMLGEGRLDFMPPELTKMNYCLICSRFTFSQNTREVVEEISYEELYEYLESKKTPKGESYLKYIYGINFFEDMKPIFDELQEKTKVDAKNEKIKIREIGNYIIVSSMIKKGDWLSWTGLTSGPVVGAVLVGGISAIITGGASIPVVAVGLLAGTAGGGVVFWKAHPSGNAYYSYPTPVAYKVEDLRDFNCNSFETAE